MDIKQAKELVNGSITNIRMKAPVSNPDNYNYYAEIRNVDGELLVSALLDYCVFCMEDAAKFIHQNS